MKVKSYKLGFELVPDGCWHSNLRSALPPEIWDKVRKAAYARAHGRCMICGAIGKLEAHERWDYVIDGNYGVQKLADVIAVCRACHEVIHIERTELCGGEERASAHFMKVNDCSYAEYRAERGRANEIHRERNKVYDWGFDISELERFL